MNTKRPQKMGSLLHHLRFVVLFVAAPSAIGQGLRACQNINSTVPAFIVCDNLSTALPSVNVSQPSSPFSYTFTGTISAPSPLVVNFSAFVTGHLRLRVDDHLVVECDNTQGNAPIYCPAVYDVPVPDLNFESNVSRIHIEFVATQTAHPAFLELRFSTTPGSNPQPIPSAWLSPSLPAQEELYLAQKESAEKG